MNFQYKTYAPYFSRKLLNTEHFSLEQSGVYLLLDGIGRASFRAVDPPGLLGELLREGVTAMTRIAGYSISQLTRLMKKHCSTTPHEYLKELRLATSFKLVTETDIPLESISYECGYRCYGYFTDVFKDKYGMTPAALRKSEKK